MALSSSWNGKGNDAPQRGEDREKPVTSLPTLQKTKTARIATVLVVDTYWGCTGTTTTSQYHFSVPCVHKKICTQKKLQVWPAQSWVKPHTAGSTRTAEKNSLVQAGYKPSGTEEFLVLSILPKDQRKGKASSRASSLFVSYSSVPATWHRKKSSWCHLTDFSCYTINGYFFFFAGKCMLLLNAFTYKLMCLCLICLDSMQIWKPNHIYLGNMIISRSTKMQSIVDWKIMINFSSFLFFNPTNIIESKPWYCRDLLTSKTSYTGAWFNWAILYIGKHTAQGFQDPLSESTYLPLSFKTMSGKHISIVVSESFPKPQFHKIASLICNNTGENTTAAKNMQLCFILLDEVKGYFFKKIFLLEKKWSLCFTSRFSTTENLP